MSLQNTSLPLAPNSTELRQEDAERAQVDACIARLENEIRELKTRRNQLASIARLPPEILSKVFICYRDAVANNYGRVNQLKWTEVTHVCRQWRSVALNCPPLWSRIAFHSRAWTEAMYERSRHAPLSISLTADSCIYRNEERVLKVFSEPHRFRNLTISGCGAFHKERIQALTAPAPLLESLALENEHYHLSELPDNFLAGEILELQQLTLNGYKLPWTSPLLHQLTSLSLTLPLGSSPSNPVPPPAPGVFLDALEKMPTLRELDLSIPLPDMSEVSARRVIPLPHLEKFKLKGSTAGCAGVLKHLALPAEVSPDITCYNLTEVDDASACTELASGLISSWISAPLCRPAQPAREIRALRLSGLTFYGCCKDIDFAELREPQDGPSFTVMIQDPMAKPRQCFLSALPLGSLQTVDIVGLNPSVEAELAIFAALPALKSVFLHSDSILGFYDYVKNDPAMRPIKKAPKPKTQTKAAASLSTVTQGQPNVSYFPALKYISIERVDWGDHEESDGVLVEEFVDFLILRYELGGEIEGLKLTACFNLFSDDVKDLEDVVVNVDWDGKEVEKEPEEDEDEYSCHGGGFFGCDCDYHDEDYDVFDDYDGAFFW